MRVLDRPVRRVNRTHLDEQDLVSSHSKTRSKRSTTSTRADDNELVVYQFGDVRGFVRSDLDIVAGKWCQCRAITVLRVRKQSRRIKILTHMIRPAATAKKREAGARTFIVSRCAKLLLRCWPLLRAHDDWQATITRLGRIPTKFARTSLLRELVAHGSWRARREASRACSRCSLTQERVVLCVQS